MICSYYVHTECFVVILRAAVIEQEYSIAKLGVHEVGYISGKRTSL